MYMEKKFFMIVFAAMMAMAAFTACGDDDASRTMSGGEMLKNISMVIVDQADAEKLYQAEENAPNMILVADTWDGKPRTVELPDDCGIISLAPAADESIFCTVSFTGLKSCDYPVLSLIIAPKEYLDGDNPSHYHEMREPIRVWRCGDCDWWTSAARPIGNKCGRCGSKNIIEPKRQR